MKKDYSNRHTFVVCAYKESPYLEECIKSLLNQTVKSNIIVATSTPCAYITDIAAKYNLPVYVNDGESGITEDWNFGIGRAKTQYVTVAHQDDVYFKHFTEAAVDKLDNDRESLICFTDYCELRDGRYVDRNLLLFIKRALLLPLKLTGTGNSRLIKRLSIRFGSSICCPSVTINLLNVERPVFQDGLKSNCDWQAWERLSHKKGSFIYYPYVLMAHRIHEGSETSNIIAEGKRQGEDLEMFRKFWPEPIAKLIAKVYASGEKSNSNK